jgi:hypothetical protein
MTPNRPIDWGHPQFDPENHRRFTEFMQDQELPMAGLTFLPPSNIQFSFPPR